MSSFASVKTGKLLQLSNQFWRALVLENFTDLESMLDCECCVLDSFNDALGTTTGIYVTLGKLREISARIQAGRLDKTIQTLQVMRSHTQSRLLVHSRGGILTSHLGIAMNWMDEKITGLIIIKNAVENTFFIDDTPPMPSFAPKQKHKNQSQSEHQRRHTHQWENSSLDTHIADLSLSPSSSSSSSSSSSLTDNNNDPSLSLSLLPPFLCPKPPSIPATLTITVLSCSNLKSCMKRVITRAVDAYVIVTVNGQERKTEVVCDTNPW